MVTCATATAVGTTTAPEEIAMTTTVGIGLIGLGSIGVTHAEALNSLRPDVSLVAYSGGSGTAAAEAGWPDAVRQSPSEVIANPAVDIVAIATPSDTHADHTLAALDAGKHVVVEKPLALTVRDAERVVARAEAVDRIVSAMAQRRLEPEVQALRDVLVSGQLGEVRLAVTQVNWWRGEDYYRQARWRGSAAAGGGSLVNQGVHNIDLLQWLAGPVASVTAQSATLAHGTGAEDTTVATLRLKSGGLGLISTSTATPPGSPATLALHCEYGTVEVGQGEFVRWDAPGVPRPTTTPAEGIGVGMSDPSAIGFAGHAQQWRDVIGAVRGNHRPTITARDGADTVRLLVAIAEAADQGREVDLGGVR
jgi:predicted dehydrogenase